MNEPSSPHISLDPTSGNVFRHDGPAGTVVFLVALPLCLGIALASGAPLFSGIIAGVVGGIVVSVASGSQVSVSGPAAGLTTIVSAAIAQLGSYEAFLLAVVVAGGIQLLMGLLRLGIIGDYFPNAVIKGMLAAIGLVIILKQIPHALGYDRDFTGDIAFGQSGEGNTFVDLLSSFLAISPGPTVVSLVAFAVLLGWEPLAKRLSHASIGKLIGLVPAPLVVVVLGICLQVFFAEYLPFLYIAESEHMVTLPVASSAREFIQQFTLPDFSAIGNPDVWSSGLTIAIVASLETLLCLEAADRIDPYKRISPTNRELFAQGVGNLVSGLIGGLPVTSVVVRTSANVYAGARTWMSSFIHGILLFGSVLLIPSVLNLTPLATLAAVLIVVGYKLTKPALFREMYRAGLGQFLPFIVTVIAIVFSDLLTGVMIGLASSLFFIIRANHHDAITVVHQDNCYLMRFNKDASFVNKSELRTRLRAVPEGAHLIVDGTRALYIDRDIREVLNDFQQLAPFKNITVEARNV